MDNVSLDTLLEEARMTVMAPSSNVQNEPTFSVSIAPRLDELDEICALCEIAFDNFDVEYLTSRYVHLTEPVFHLAHHHKELVGFKLAYRRGASMLYSWLGAVHPGYRRMGIAGDLMRRQHVWARAEGFQCVETRTRNSNSPMIMLNLREGFTIVGYEVDRSSIGVVTQRKLLPS